MFNYIIIGAGFAGAVLAERIASRLDKKVLVIDKRSHIGGNCYDHFDKNGILIHKYGPHLFHTDSKMVLDYLSQFTGWLNYHHKVLAYIDGQNIPIPFNLNSIRLLFPEYQAELLEKKLITKFGYGKKVPILELRKEDDTDLKFLSDFIYEKVFASYTSKQWGCKPEEISPEVTARVPVHISKDDRYFQDRYQSVPQHGYTKIFERLLSHENISLLLQTDYKDVIDFNQKTGAITLFGNPFDGKLIFTGMIDEFFDFKFGRLPYRSLQFSLTNLAQESFQQATTINYPNDYDFTRITEFKKLTAQKSNTTTIVKEFPQDYDPYDPQKNVPYYPFFKEENIKKYEKYQHHSSQFKNITFIGRLAEYRYYDMDDIVERALNVFESEFSK
jgi:UDP-galactopyranose mutase